MLVDTIDKADSQCHSIDAFEAFSILMLDSVCEESEFEFFGYYKTPETTSAGNTPMNSDTEDVLSASETDDPDASGIESNDEAEESETEMSYNYDTDNTYISDYEY